MLTYAIHQKNPVDKDHYRCTSDVYFTNGSSIEEMEKIFEMKNFGNFLLPNGTKRFFVTTDKGLLIETPFLTESVTLDWYEQSNKACLVLPYPYARITNWIASHKKQLAEKEAHQVKVVQYYKDCLKIVGDTTLTEMQLALAKDVMNLDWYCDYSDDPRVRRAGEASIAKMELKLKEHGLEGFMKAFTSNFMKR